MWEIELAKKAIAGDEQAFIEIYELYEDVLYRVGSSYFHVERDAVEAIQELTYRSFKKIHTAKDSSTVDANNLEFYSREVSEFTGDGGYNNSSYTFNMKDKVNPIRLYLWSYPNYLNGSAEIKIPLNGRD